MQQSLHTLDNSILKVEQRPAKGELKKHLVERGKRFVFVDNNNFPSGDLYIIARVVRNIKNKYESALPRKHSVDAVMLFMGARSDLTGMVVEVEIAGRTRTLSSPAAAYVRAGLVHSYRILKGSGTYVKIVQAPGGNYNAVTK